MKISVPFSLYLLFLWNGEHSFFWQNLSRHWQCLIKFLSKNKSVLHFISTYSNCSKAKFILWTSMILVHCFSFLYTLIYAFIFQSNKIKKAVVTNDKSAIVPPKPRKSMKNESVTQVTLYVFLIYHDRISTFWFAKSLYHTNFHLNFVFKLWHDGKDTG